MPCSRVATGRLRQLSSVGESHAPSRVQKMTGLPTHVHHLGLCCQAAQPHSRWGSYHSWNRCRHAKRGARSGGQLVQLRDVHERGDQQGDGEGADDEAGEPQVAQHVDDAAAQEGLGLRMQQPLGFKQ